MSNKRCTECNGELSYCGEMTADGPSLDCRCCQLSARIAELETALAAAREQAVKPFIDAGLALPDGTPRKIVKRKPQVKAGGKGGTTWTGFDWILIESPAALASKEPRT